MKSMNGCGSGKKQIVIGSVCFGAGILLSLFLPAVVLIIIEAVLICGVGVLSFFE